MITYLIPLFSVWLGFYCPYFAERSIELHRCYLPTIKQPTYVWILGFKASIFLPPLSAEWRTPLGCFGTSHLQVPSWNGWGILRILEEWQLHESRTCRLLTTESWSSILCNTIPQRKKFFEEVTWTSKWDEQNNSVDWQHTVSCMALGKWLHLFVPQLSCV